MDRIGERDAPQRGPLAPPRRVATSAEDIGMAEGEVVMRIDERDRVPLGCGVT
ncbi:MAG: hypothetical protein AB8I08_03055 [Sandaracinaceae bacterium]